ncbi:cytochrome c biogenesis CcdA family protein [Halorientalis brevis]|uniref:Cytochrome c biogenesis CcdA family protein n=1 Tax=Halorientalis brevis TaxID=1126241 RepID=A0ABD6CD28_9EURY|nr:cytochrome c biogenesis protein CcdA [Halorientalis brevis]
MIDLASLRLGFAFGLGTATFFAPCAFPLLPGYVGYYLGKTGGDTPEGTLPLRLGRAALVGLFTSLGFFLVYAALAGVAIAAGTQILGHVGLLELVVGLLLIGLGIGMATGRLQASSLHVQLPERRRSVLGYVLFGVIYAAAAAGCTAPFFVAIVSLSLNSGPAATIVTLGAYAAGMSVLMIGVTMLSALGRDTLVRQLSARTGVITRAAGAVMVLAGLVQLYYYLFEFGGLKTLGFA